MGHTRSCTALTPGEACTCCLGERNALGTEQTMHRAWRKRAEEAEIEIVRLRAALADIADSSSVTATAVQMVRTLQGIAREVLYGQASLYEGWQLVPKELSLGMAEAAMCVMDRGLSYHYLNAAYKAMLAAVREAL